MTRNVEKDAPKHTPEWPCGGRIVCPACAARRADASTENDSPAHLAPEVELRLERMADAANEAEIRWLIGEWLTEIASVIPPGEKDVGTLGTGAGEGAPRQDTGSAWVTRSADCPEAPAQAQGAHVTSPGTTERGEQS